MIAFLEGVIAGKTTDTLTLNVGGVGFLLRANPRTLGQVGQKGESALVHTSLIVREDAMELFGFLTREELYMFERLTAISGVGPRTALGLLSALSAGDIAIAVATGDAKALTRAPGIGPKTAQRMILELKDRITEQDFGVAGGAPVPDMGGGDDAAREAVLALAALGYTSVEAAKAVQAVLGDQEEMPPADKLVLLSLRRLGGGL